MSIRPGARIGIDVGTVRIGIAQCDIHGMLATPAGTVARNANAVADVVQRANDIDALEIVVGLPLALSGAHTASTEDAMNFAKKLAAAGPRPVRLVDERLSTVSAQQALHSTGKTTRNSRAVIDQVAATIILQHALDAERSSAKPPGEVIAPHKG